MKSIISSKQTSRIDFGLVDRLNNEYERNGGNAFKPIEDIFENIDSKVTFDNVPKLMLKELESTVVHVPTLKQYDTLMQVYECAGWRWVGGKIATDNYFPHQNKNKTCINAIISFWSGDLLFFKKNTYEILTDTEFYKIQNITPQDLGQINEYFDKTKPNRASKK